MLFHPSIEQHKRAAGLTVPVPLFSTSRGLLLANVGFWTLFIYSSRHNLGVSIMKGWKPLAAVSLVGLAVAWETLHELSAESRAVVRDSQAMKRAEKSRS